MYKIFGWINFIIAFVMLLPFALKDISKKKGGVLDSVGKFLRKLHKPLGGIILVPIVIHAVLALGAFTLHTGTVLGIAYLIVALLGSLFVLMKKKQIFSLHRYAAFIFVLLVMIHLVVPSLLG